MRPPRVLEHRFNGPAFTIGIEEELMILDPDGFGLAQAIEGLLDDVPAEIDGQVKPEFLQAFLEIATKPHPDVRSAGEELRSLRRAVSAVAEGRGLAIGAAGTHPFARWEEQLVVERERYRELADALGYILRQFVIFGTHVHVGIEGADRAVYVADGLRRHLPILLALSANSPLMRGHETGMMSTRTPIFRALPRSGIPPHYGTWEIYSNRVEQMMQAGAIGDYTYLWWDVRPHPNLGTVETRIFDQQTRVEHTEALAAITVSLAHRLSRRFDEGAPLVAQPGEFVDDNKIRAALHGIEGSLVDYEKSAPVPAADLAQDLLDELAEDAADLGCTEQLAGIDDLLARGTGARRQLDFYDRHADLDELMREIIERSRA